MLEPTVIIHRGHSYWLPSTINQLPSSGQLIFLGSCGGYQSLDKILKVCPAAQIIASKQTGSGLVNQPIIYTILENYARAMILTGRNCGHHFQKNSVIMNCLMIMFHPIKIWVRFL